MLDLLLGFPVALPWPGFSPAGAPPLRLRAAAAMGQRAGADLRLDAAAGAQRPGQRHAGRRSASRAAAVQQRRRADRHDASSCCPMPCCRSTPRWRGSTPRCCAPATGSAPPLRDDLPSGAAAALARGLATAATFTFLLSLGFFVTPALLGGPADTTMSMLIDSFVDERLDWPLAAAASLFFWPRH